MRSKLISILAAIAFSLLASGFALAARTGVKAPSPSPLPVYSWTGWYIGGNVGYGQGNASTALNGSGSSTTFTSVDLHCSPPNCPPEIDTTVPASFAFAASNTAHPNGLIGGGQIGYNYQFSPNWVASFEADIQGSGERASDQFTVPFVTSFCDGQASDIDINTCDPGRSVPINGAMVTSYQAKIGWFGTVRARLGMLVANQLLIYGTGGLAYGEVAVSGNANISATAPGFPPFLTPTTAAFGASKTNVGYALGAGVEGRLLWLPPNWTWKLEYLYLDLGSVNTTTPFVMISSCCTSNITGNFTTHTHFTDNIVRAGLNYQFH